MLELIIKGGLFLLSFVLLRSTVSVAGSSSNSASGNSVTCPNGFTAYKEKCYAVSPDDTYTWVGAKAYCSSLAQMAFLACPEEKKETDEIKTYFDGYAWLGINDLEYEGVWWCNSRWEAIYTRWDKDHPIDDNDAINCVTIKDNGKWFNFACTETYYAFCELDPLATTTQAPTTTQEPTTTQAPTTAQEPTTTQAPATTQEPTTTQAPATTQEPTTTQAPATTQEPTTTHAPTTTQEPKTTHAPTTTQEPTTTHAPTTTQEPTTTHSPTTARKMPTTEETTTVADTITTTIPTTELTTTPEETTTVFTTSQKWRSTTNGYTTTSSPTVESKYTSYVFKRTDTSDTPKMIMQNDGVMSSIKCAVNCSNNINCSAFLFHRTDGYGEAVCELLGESHDPSATLSLSSDKRLYVKHAF